MSTLKHILLVALIFVTQITCTLTVLLTNDTFQDRIASFGARLPDSGLVGQLVPILKSSDFYDLSDGCAIPNLPEAQLPKKNTNGIEIGRFAMVQRGNCSFIVKVRAMQALGFRGVVVGNNDRSGLVTMYANGDTSDVAIPAVFITQKEMRNLALLYHQNKDTDLLIRLSPNDYLQPLLDVIIVTVLSPAVMMAFVYMMWLIRRRQIKKAQRAPTHVVNSLPTRTFYISKWQERESRECSICLEDYVDDDELRVLPCRHAFHIICIDPWLTSWKKFCPVCKRDICPPTERTPLLGGPPINQPIALELQDPNSTSIRH